MSISHKTFTGKMHNLKTVQPYYDASASGDKTFEIRKNDRDFKVGDILRLYEWDGEKATGREHWKQITYILDNTAYLSSGMVCLAVKRIIKEETENGI